jgi:acyl-CoA thioester hydrolase
MSDAAKAEIRPLARYSRRFGVAAEDIDEMGHASNQCYLRWVMEAAEEHSSAVGLGLAEYRAGGAAFVVKRHEIDYLRSALEDDELEVTTWISEWSAASCQRSTAIRRVSDDAVLAKAVTTWVYVSLERQRPKRIPESILERFRPGA